MSEGGIKRPNRCATLLRAAGSCNFSIDLGIDGNGCPSHQTAECSASIQAWLNSTGAASNDLDLYDYYAEGTCTDSNTPSTGIDAPCIEDRTAAYLQRGAVRTALHVAPEASAWTGCSTPLNNAYNCADTLVSMVPLYAALRSSGVRVLIYSGDVDGIVPTAASRRWVEGVSARGAELVWRRWHLDAGALAGYTFEAPDAEGRLLWFATVKGAGHMVPRFKGEAAKAMASRFMQGKPL